MSDDERARLSGFRDGEEANVFAFVGNTPGEVRYIVTVLSVIGIICSIPGLIVSVYALYISIKQK